MREVLGLLLADFFREPVPDARRILHGRGHCFPGLETLNLDWYHPVVLVSAYAPLENPDWLVEDLLAADVHGQIEGIILQQRDVVHSPAQLLWGSAQEKFVVSEGALRFFVQPGRRQNAGLFLDTRLLRDWLLIHSADRNVLNLFAYTCSLSVAALAGGARAVTNVDMSKPSMLWGAENHALNGQDIAQVKAIPHNLFKSWGRIQQFGRYDLVIIDPPTRQKGSFDVERDYAAVVKKLPKLCHPGAEVIATLNSPFLDTSFLLTVFETVLPQCEFVEMLPTPPEFADADPEKALKIARFRMPVEQAS